MIKKILLFSALIGAFTLLIRVSGSNFLTGGISHPLYLSLLTLSFTAFGIFIGYLLLDLKRQSKIREDALPETPTGLSAQPATSVTIESLTAREIEVLNLIDQGYSNGEIAELLFISLSTVKSHNAATFGKLGVKRRMQAVNLAKELSILS